MSRLRSAKPTNTGLGKMNKVYGAEFTVSAGNTPTMIDLSSLTDTQGNAMNFSVVNCIHIENSSDIIGQIMTVGGGRIIRPIEPSAGCALCCGNEKIKIDENHHVLVISVAAGIDVPGRVTVGGW